MSYTLEQGKRLIQLARESILGFFSNKEAKVGNGLKAEFRSPSGIYVTLKKNGLLRGRMGFSDARYPLYEGIVKAGQSAALTDQRFPPVEADEMEKISIEASILSRPKLVEVRNPEDLLENISIGTDGLIVIGTFHSGLLLPQVAVESKWDSKRFLEQTCIKAGLPKNAWEDFNQCRVYTFQCQTFAEHGSNVAEVNLKPQKAKIRR